VNVPLIRNYKRGLLKGDWEQHGWNGMDDKCGGFEQKEPKTMSWGEVGSSTIQIRERERERTKRHIGVFD
jgi:hypothetical protein